MAEKQSIWVSFRGHCCPTTVHRFLPNGEPDVAVVGFVDETSSREERVIVNNLTRLPGRWESEDWGTFENYTGPHGLLFVDDGTPAAHSVLAAAELKRTKTTTFIAPAEGPDDSGEVGGNSGGQLPPQKPILDPRDIDKDGIVTKAEKKLARLKEEFFSGN